MILKTKATTGRGLNDIKAQLCELNAKRDRLSGALDVIQEIKPGIDSLRATVRLQAKKCGRIPKQKQTQ